MLTVEYKTNKHYENFMESLKNFQGDTNCPVFRTLSMLQGKWTLRVIFFLMENNSLRFGEIKRKLPNVTNTMLTATLKELESDEIILRTQFNEIPPRVEYSLTEKGNTLVPIFVELGKWEKKYNA